MPICNASLVTFLMKSRCPRATMMVLRRLSVKDSSWCKQWSLHTPTSSSGDPRGMRMRRNLSKRSTFCFSLSSSRSEMTSNSSGGGDPAAVISPQMAIGKCFFSNLTDTSGTHVVHAATLDGKRSPVSEWISRLRRQRQHREHHVSLDFELSTHESLHSIQPSLVRGCAQCSGWRVSSSSVTTAHMSFDLVRYSVTVDSSSFAVSVPGRRWQNCSPV